MRTEDVVGLVVLVVIGIPLAVLAWGLVALLVRELWIYWRDR